MSYVSYMPTYIKYITCTAPWKQFVHRQPSEGALCMWVLRNHFAWAEWTLDMDHVFHSLPPLAEELSIARSPKSPTGLGLNVADSVL